MMWNEEAPRGPAPHSDWDSAQAPPPPATQEPEPARTPWQWKVEATAPAAEQTTYSGLVADKPWASKRVWEEDVADVSLERELFESELAIDAGINFKRYREIPVAVDGEDVPDPFQAFTDLELPTRLMENVILMKYKEPTPIQQYAIPIMLAGRDLMATAQTGSGKTAAFLIPIIAKLLFKGKDYHRAATQKAKMGARFRATPLALIMVPTRELACQIFDEARKFAYQTWVRPAVVYGGASARDLEDSMSRGCDILVATPGKLKWFIENGKITLSFVKYLVLDEADRMLDYGFEKDIRRLVLQQDMPRGEARRTAMFSATFPRPIRQLAKQFLVPDHIKVTVGRVGLVPEDIRQRFLYVEESEKMQRLQDILYDQEPDLTLVFVSSKRVCDTLDEFFYRRGFPVTSIHGDRTQMEREDAISAFKSKKIPLMIATDVAARGLDTKVRHVINYDLPNEIDAYIHRIGRTARVGNAGYATSFYNSNNEPIAEGLVQTLLACNQTVPDFLSSYVPAAEASRHEEKLGEEGEEEYPYPTGPGGGMQQQAAAVGGDDDPWASAGAGW
ncbi:DEAD-box ATP-dependent RNA helicase [Quaeritorhiza haematococci]|nr:DEAD-box ATP-dependent RNA helicase [Quaeritorhiza haematococci]